MTIALFLLFAIVFLVIMVADHYYSKVIIRKEEVFLKNLKKEYRFIHLSDLHFGRFTANRMWSTLIERLEELAHQEIDAIIFTGDNVDLGKKYIPLLKKFLKIIRSLFPNVVIISVPGDHDYGEAPEEVKTAFEKIGGIYLESDGVFFNNIFIIGLMPVTSEIFGMERKYKVEDRKNWLKEFDYIQIKPRVVLTHYPDIAILLQNCDMKPDLILAGHTHGGQLLPVRWVCSLLRFFSKLIPPMGCRENIEGIPEIINRGVGTTASFNTCPLPPFRLLSSPEIVLVELRPQR